MRAVAVIGIAAAAVLAAGIWLGRSLSPSHSTAETHAAPRRDRSAVIPAPTTVRARVPTVPALAARRSSPVPQAPGLAADLVSADPKIRRAAVREAARSADVDPGILLAASRDPDLEVGAVATEALGKLHARGEVPVQEMIARATDRTLDQRVRVSALNGLGQVASAEAAQTLAELLARGDTLERRSAAILLVHQDAELAVPALIDALGDADEFVRDSALNSLRARSRGRDFGGDAGAWRAWWQSRSR